MHSGAWFQSSASEFKCADISPVVGQLATAHLKRGFSATPETIRAWDESLPVLQEAFDVVSERLGAGMLDAWGVCLEYEIPRRSLRPDAVLLVGSAVVVLEFKTGESRFDRSSKMQVEEYARDLRDFHEQSHGCVVVPLLVAWGDSSSSWDLDVDPLLDFAQCSSPADLGVLLVNIWERFGSHGVPIDLGLWASSRYRPTPNILQTASDVYAGHQVREITHAYADNLDSTVEALRSEIQSARESGRRRVCFVTGVPGSGKTLTGLSAVHDVAAGVGSKPLGAYLSGNGPLVKVLRYSIARDLSIREGVLMKSAQHEASTFIQPVHFFIRDHLNDSDLVPVENVVVFDEAQRAWDRKRMMSKNDVGESQAGVMLDIMSRIPGWSVVVALIGDGQEINAGEAGIAAWVEALECRPEWQIATSPGAGKLFFQCTQEVQTLSELHLSVSVRSPRSRAITDWIDALLAGDCARAVDAAASADGFPMSVSRSLEEVRAYLRDRVRVDRRVGLVASAHARRLRAFGVEMDGNFRSGIDWPRWFVEPPTDIRSSCTLEVAASEFECQGLELDWTGVCWGSDLLWDVGSGSWIARRLRGTRWISDGVAWQALNRYRVLLSRARLGMVIWVPEPNTPVPLVDDKALDQTYEVLLAAGCQPLEVSIS